MFPEESTLNYLDNFSVSENALFERNRHWDWSNFHTNPVIKTK